MLEIFLKTLPFFLLIGTGWLAGKTRFFPPEATAWLTKFVFYFALSAMLFGFAATLDIDRLFDPHFVLAYLTGSLALWLLAFGVAKWRKLPLDHHFLALATSGTLTNGSYIDVLFVLDQAYAEYLEPEEDDGGLELAANASNVLVTRTFSKIHGLAAERIGWGYGAAEIIEALHRIRAPFNVTTAGQAAAAAAIADVEWVEACRESNSRERDRFSDAMNALGNHGISVVPSKANFILVLFEGALSAEQAYQELMAAGYAVRWLPGQGLPARLAGRRPCRRGTAPPGNFPSAPVPARPGRCRASRAAGGPA